MNHLAVHPDVHRRYPRQHTLLLGPVDVTLGAPVDPAIMHQLRERCASQAEAWRADVPSPVLHWRELLRGMGARSAVRSSVDALYRRYVRTGTLPEIHPLVDLYNWTSLAYLVPMAGYDAPSLRPGLELRFARPGEPFVALGADAPEPPESPAEVVYADEDGVVCRFWNWRDAHRTRIRPETRSVLFMADLTADTADAAADAAAELARVLGAALDVSLDPRIHPIPASHA